MNDLKGKVAVITGGASGIGLATATELARRGAKLVLGDIEEDALGPAVESIEALGADALGVVCDVASPSSVAALRDAALDRFSAVHVVFNNAGVAGGQMLTTPIEVWNWVMSVNVTGVVNGINAFLPVLMDQDEGHIVNTASLAGLGGVPGMGPYCASKFAVVGLSESLWHELEMVKSNVDVSVLCPGFVNTRIFESERNIPKDLVEWTKSQEAKAVGDFAKNAVQAGIEPSIVANEVVAAILEPTFWILPHKRVGLATTKQRLDWMDGGHAPGIDLQEATKR